MIAEPSRHLGIYMDQLRPLYVGDTRKMLETHVERLLTLQEKTPARILPFQRFTRIYSARPSPLPPFPPPKPPIPITHHIDIVF